MIAVPLVLGVRELPAIVLRRLSVLMLFLVLHTLVVTVALPVSARAFSTVLALAIYITAMCVALNVCLRDDFLLLRKVILIFLCLQIFLHVLELAGIYDPNANWTRQHYLFGFAVPTGFFREASHVGMSLAPLIFLWRTPSRLNRQIAALAALSVGLSLSTTGLSIIVAMSLVFMFRSNQVSSRFKKAAALVLAAFVPFLVLSADSLPEVTERFMSLSRIIAGEADGSENMSSLIYMNGASMALAGLNDIVGAGAGQMLRYYADAPYTILIELINSGEMMNRDDGGSTVFKLLAEFGYFGLVFLGFYLAFVVRMVRKGLDPLVTILAMYFMITMIRGASYFDAPICVSVALYLFSPLLFERFGRRARTQDRRQAFESGPTLAAKPTSGA
ncbi:MAG: hypothetical protein EP335_15810 [Alphaproteobacteria bacterium]|nr:MAG: hypothetical protein EP335_15810 [Alphaproteobacteria bacterium]